MKSKAILASVLTLVALAFTLMTVSASAFPSGNTCIPGENANDWICITDVEVDGTSYAVDAIGDAVGFDVSQTVPVVVRFIALKDVTDVRIKVYTDGFKDNIEDETPRFRVIEGNTYTKKFSLSLPSTLDLDELSSEKLALLIRASARGEDSLELELPVEVQKNLYSLEILSIDSSEVVSAGETVPIDVVVVNNGFDRLDNVYVQATIAGLGISRKIYVGDLESTRDEFDTDINDARERRIYLTIPKSATPGNYEVVVEAYNYDASVNEKARLVVREVETKIIPPTAAKTIAPGEEAQFDVALVNPSSGVMVYTITPEESEGFFVEATEPVVIVGAESSKTTKIKVKASDSVAEGTHIVTVNTMTESGTAQPLSFTVNVKKPQMEKENDVVSGKPNTVVVLTVILVIIFVVLLIILIVLLTRRPAESEEFGETNYY